MIFCLCNKSFISFLWKKYLIQINNNNLTDAFAFLGAQGAPFACYKEINSLRDKFGNCGFKNSQPLPCEQRYVYRK